MIHYDLTTGTAAFPSASVIVFSLSDGRQIRMATGSGLSTFWPTSNIVISDCPQPRRAPRKRIHVRLGDIGWLAHCRELKLEQRHAVFDGSPESPPALLTSYRARFRRRTVDPARRWAVML